jgi:hypothetical protein
MDSNRIINKKLHIIKDKSLKLAEDFNIHQQYLDSTNIFYRGLCISYSRIFKYIGDRKSVLDFGAGIGCSQFVYDINPQGWDLSLSDMVDYDWRKNEENIFFNSVRNSMGYDVIPMNNIMSDNFYLKTEDKFDCIIFFRFPPLTEYLISAKSIKEKMQPWITDDCIFIYANSYIHYKENCDFFKLNNYTTLEAEEPLVITKF